MGEGGRETLLKIEQPKNNSEFKAEWKPCAIVGDKMRDIGYFKNFQRWMDRDQPSQLSDIIPELTGIPEK